MAEHPKSSAHIFDTVRWDYDPEDDQLSALVPAERYFRNFPWEPEEEEEGDEAVSESDPLAKGEL